MKKSIIFLFILASILSACSSQVTVTSEVTVTLTPLPTSTSTLTPTATPVTANMSEADKQIFDAASEAATGIEDIKPELDPIWGVVSKNKDGEVEKYWKYFPYNYDKGEWVEASVGDGHLNIVDKNGKESIVYPERITLNVNGKEITYNTTARGYKENVTPQTPKEYMRVIEALAQAITEGSELRPFGENPFKLGDFMILRGFNGNSEARVVLDIPSNEWVEKEPNELPYSPVVFPYILDGMVIDGLVLTPVMVAQKDGSVSGWWSIGIVKAYWTKYSETSEIQRFMDGDFIEKGGKSANVPFNYRTIETCKKSVANPELDSLCEELIRESNDLIEEFELAIGQGKVTEKLKLAEYIPIGVMSKIAK